MKRFIIIILSTLTICAALAACRRQAVPAEPDTPETTTRQLTVIHPATETDAEPAAATDADPTGKVYHTDERIFSVTYQLEQIVDFPLLENAVTVTADCRGTGTANRKVTLEENAVGDLIKLLQSFRVTPVTSEETAAARPEQAAYFEWTEEDGTIHRFSALKTETACCLAFSWELLTGEDLDDPALLFRVEDFDRTDGIFCFN